MPDLNGFLVLLNTLFTGGVLVMLITATWKISSFVRWVKNSLEQNEESILKIEIGAMKMGERLTAVERNNIRIKAEKAAKE